MKRESIVIRDAYENNLKHVHVEVPKHCLTVFTGVSGSGKSSLVLDTIAAQSRRELNDTFPSFVQHYLPKYGRPHVGSIENLPVAIVIDQKKPAPNLRSTVGTYTDTYALLRLLFSRVGKPFVGYSDTFSFNHPQGSCPRCDGLGEVTELDIHKLVDFDKCLNDPGVIHYPTFEPGQWRWIRYARSGLFDLDKKIRDYSQEELELFLYSHQIKLKDPPAGWPKTAKYEGLVHRMYRSVLHSEEGKLHAQQVAGMTRHMVCPDCGGARLNPKVLSCTMQGKNIAQVAALPLEELLGWLEQITDPLAVDIKQALHTRITALTEIGLSYLTLDRGLSTLSGGEIQRCKIAKYMTASMSDIVYILDEPSVGLHSHDIQRLLNAIGKLRDRGNTVLLVEHHREMIAAADHIIDLGPASGRQGGEITFQGTYGQLLESDTHTGKALRAPIIKNEHPRTAKDWLSLQHVSYHNLKDLSVSIPTGVLTAVTGVAGAGKSSLMEVFYHTYPQNTIYINQKSIGANLRSTPATYMGVADEIRKIFASRCGQKASLFSFNGEGRCPVCGGKGVIISDMAFMDAIETPCEACGGLRFSQEVLSHTVDGMNIAQVMDLSVEQALIWLGESQAAKRLEPLEQVGLSYLHLNQALSTLSGGELQRMKLASHLNLNGSTFILDEPTNGLHLDDIHRILQLFHHLVDCGNTVILIDHSLDVVASADYILELGPEGGEAGGHLLFQGTPTELLEASHSVTAPYLKAKLGL